jgi:hypothetical protein
MTYNTTHLWVIHCDEDEERYTVRLEEIHTGDEGPPIWYEVFAEFDTLDAAEEYAMALPPAAEYVLEHGGRSEGS